jgi:hypothetical protein
LTNTIDDALDMVGMVNFLPTPALHVFKSGAGIVVPAFVVPINPTLGVGGPGELADVVGELSKAHLAFA